MADDAKKKGEGKAQDAAEEANPDQQTKKPGLKRAVIIGLIVVVDLIAMGGIAWFIVQKIQTDDPATAEARKIAEEESRKREMITSMGTALDKPITLTVNLAEPGEPRYLKVAIQLEWDATAHPKLGEALNARMPRISDRAILILSSQTMEKLLRPDGKEFIRESLVKDVNAMLPEKEGRIRSAYFTEFLLQ